MGYILGAIKYMVKSSIKNTGPMLVFGAATLAILRLVEELAKGRPIAAITDYAITKYLPPFTVSAFMTILIVGCVWAGVKWYAKAPR